MTATAKLFKTGSSQAVRLPKAYRLPGNEAWIRKIEASGEIVLKPKPVPSRLKELFRLIDEGTVPGSFLAKRHNPPELPRNRFADEAK